MLKNKTFKILTAIVIITTMIFANVEINETNFPCPNFRNWILEQSWGSDGIITAAEIAEITNLRIINNKSITDLTGIEHFSALTHLWCYNNNLTFLNVSALTNLQTLNCCMFIEIS